MEISRNADITLLVARFRSQIFKTMVLTRQLLIIQSGLFLLCTLWTQNITCQIKNPDGSTYDLNPEGFYIKGKIGHIKINSAKLYLGWGTFKNEPDTIGGVLKENQTAFFPIQRPHQILINYSKTFSWPVYLEDIHKAMNVGEKELIYYEEKEEWILVAGSKDPKKHDGVGRRRKLLSEGFEMVFTNESFSIKYSSGFCKDGKFQIKKIEKHEKGKLVPYYFIITGSFRGTLKNNLGKTMDCKLKFKIPFWTQDPFIIK